MERLHQFGRVDDLRRHRNLERAPLPLVHHFDRALQHHVLRLDTFAGQLVARLSLDALERRLDLGRVGAVGRAHEAVGKVVLDVDQQAAQCRGDAGVRRHDHRRDRQFTRDRGPVQRARAAEGAQGEVARIVAARDRQQAHGVSHVSVGHAHDRLGGLVQLHAERLGHRAAHGVLGQLRVQRDLAARQRGAEPPEHHVRVGVGRDLVAVPVAGGPRIGAGRLRPVAQRPALVPPGQRPAARADGQHLDRREADRKAVLDVPVLGDARLSLVRDRHVGRRAAHVEADRVRVAAEVADESTGDRTRGNARSGQSRGEVADRLGRHHAAAGMEQQQFARIAAIGQLVRQARHVIDHHGRHDRVGHGGREPLVLENFGHDLRRDRDRNVRHDLFQDVAHALLVGAVHVGVHEAHGDRRHAAFLQDARHAVGVVLVQPDQDLALCADAFAHGQAVAARDVGLGHVLVGVPKVFLVGAPDLDHVAKALGADHRRARQVAGDQRVGRHGRPVREHGHVRQVDPRLVDAVHDRAHRVVRGRGGLLDPDRAGRLVHDADVCEGAPHVDGDSGIGHAGVLFCIGQSLPARRSDASAGVSNLGLAVFSAPSGHARRCGGHVRRRPASLRVSVGVQPNLAL